MEGDRDRAGKVLLPGLREDHASAGAVPCDREGMGGTEPAGDDRVRDVRPASASEPPGRALCPRRRSDRAVDHGRRDRLRVRGARSAATPCRGSRHGGRAAAWRRHHRARSGQRQADTGRCWVYVRDDTPFGGAGPPAAIFYYSRDRRGEHLRAQFWRDIRESCMRTPTTATTSCILPTETPALFEKRRVGRMRGVPSSPWRTSTRTRVARPRARGKSRCRRSPSRSCAASTRCSRSSARSTARVPRSACRSSNLEPATGRCSRGLSARTDVKAVARTRPRQGDPIHAQALAGLPLFLEDGRV